MERDTVNYLGCISMKHADFFLCQTIVLQKNKTGEQNILRFIFCHVIFFLTRNPRKIKQFGVD